METDNSIQNLSRNLKNRSTDCSYDIERHFFQMFLRLMILKKMMQLKLLFE